MKPIAFLLKHHEPEAVKLCEILVFELAKRGLAESAMVVAHRGDRPKGIKVLEESRLPADLQMLIVLGGDGTLLYGAQLLAGHNAPMLGVNLGHLGFLSAGSRDEAVSLMLASLEGGMFIEERTRLSCRIYRFPKPMNAWELEQKPEFAFEAVPLDTSQLVTEYTALNDVVLSQPAQARLFGLTAYLDGELITDYRADGLVISTPTGSTAYNLAAGGPILHPKMQGFVITPICPHTLTARPLVAPLSSNVNIFQGKHVEKIMVTVDGQAGRSLEPSEFVQVSCHANPVRLLRKKKHSFFDVLRTKLHWGSRGAEC